MKTLYVVLVQNEEYVNPEICLNYCGETAIYQSKEAAIEFINYIVDKGYPIEDYSIGEINKVEI